MFREYHAKLEYQQTHTRMIRAEHRGNTTTVEGLEQRFFVLQRHNAAEVWLLFRVLLRAHALSHNDHISNTKSTRHECHVIHSQHSQFDPGNSY